MRPQTPEVRQAQNTWVDPPILIMQEIWFSFSRMGTNSYLSTKTGEELASAGLTPLQKGHRYEVEFDKERARVSNPLRVVDAETVPAISGLLSLQNEDPGILRNPKHATRAEAHRPPALTYDFSLSRKEYEEFRVRALRLGWQLVEPQVGLEQIRERIDTMWQTFNDAQATIKAIRDAVDKVVIDKNVFSDAEGHSLMARLSEVTESLTKLVREANKVDKDINLVDPSQVSREDQASLDLALARVVSLRPLALSDEADALYQHIVDLLTEGATEGLVQPLADEIMRLALYYPVIKSWVRAEGKDSLRIDIKSGALILTPSSIRVEGDLTTLIQDKAKVVKSTDGNLARGRVEGRFAEWNRGR